MRAELTESIISPVDSKETLQCTTTLSPVMGSGELAFAGST